MSTVHAVSMVYDKILLSIYMETYVYMDSVIKSDASDQKK